MIMSFKFGTKTIVQATNTMMPGVGHHIIHEGKLWKVLDITWSLDTGEIVLTLEPVLNELTRG